MKLLKCRPADSLSPTLSALADPTRRAILARLSTGEATVNELAAPFDISLPAISRHLKVLEAAGLISRGRVASAAPAGWSRRPLQAARRLARALPALLGGELRQDGRLSRTITKERPPMTAHAERQELADDELLITRTFDAPVALVFRLWEDREH